MLSLILPTLNEAENLPGLIREVSAALGGIAHEIIVVDDDSPDRTWQAAESLAKGTPTIRVIRRIGRRGLSSAVVEGFDAARGEILAVMDADGQHDVSRIPALRDAIVGGNDLAVASRYALGGGTGDWTGLRPALSRLGTLLAQRLPNVRVSDPMSGFFAVRTDAYRAVRSALRPTGFKILLELLACLPQSVRVAEVPMRFGLRRRGQSKLSARVQLQFLSQICRIAARRVWTSPYQWLAVGVIAVLAGFPLALRASALSPLYTDAALRARAVTALRDIAAQRGWLLSDIALDTVTEQGMAFTLRRHHRGADETSCLVTSFARLDPVPCARAR
jgi:dolichol-phosphate mannosyltransferase